MDKHNEVPLKSERSLSNFFKFAKSLTRYSLTIGAIYLSGFLKISPYWMLLPALLLALKDQFKADQEFKQHTAMSVALMNEKSFIHSHFDVLPSWVCFPDIERCEWFNIILARLWPYFNSCIMDVLKSQIEPEINKKLSAYIKDSFKIRILSLGTVPPRVSGIKVYEKKLNRKKLVVDIHLFYAGDCDFSFSLLGLTGGIQNIQIRGLIRFVMKPLISIAPLIGGIDIFFLTKPDIEFKLVGVADILNMPGFSGRIRKIIDDQIVSSMVQPNKISFNLSKDCNKIDFLEIEGVLCVNVIEAKDLVNKDFSINGRDVSDPYLILSVGDQTFKSSVIKDSLNPKWNFWAEFVIRDLYGEVLQISVLDKDEITEDSPLGNISIEIDLIEEIGEKDTWMSLENTKSGKIHFSLFFLKLSSNPEDYRSNYKPRSSSFTSCSLLDVYIDSADNVTSPQSTQNPDLFTLISVGNNVKSSKTILESCNPLFEEVFTFLLLNPELEKLQIKIIDNRNKKSLGNISFDIMQLLDCNNLELLDQTIPFYDSPSDSTISLSMRLRILKNC